MKNKTSMKNRKIGFTLIEIVLAMAILSLVVMAVYNFLLAGNKTFYAGSNQYDAQSEMRMVSDFVIKNTRFASDITIQSPIDSTLDLDYNYMYISNGFLINQATNGSTHTEQRTGGNINTSTFTMTTTNSKVMLYISLSKNSGDKNYQLQTNTELPNMSLKRNDISKSGTVIKYSKSLDLAYTPTSPSSLPTSSVTTTPTTSIETTAPPTHVAAEFYTLVENYNKYTMTLTSLDPLIVFTASVDPIGSPPRLFKFDSVPVNCTYYFEITHLVKGVVVKDKWGEITIGTSDYRMLLDDPEG